MITVWGGQTSRSLRAVWVLEEMGLPYRLRQVDMLAAERDPAWLAVNPGDFLPAIQDGDVTMVESVAIMEYLMGRYGPTPLQPSPDDLAFPTYQQFLHMGEAGLATLQAGLHTASTRRRSSAIAARRRRNRPTSRSTPPRAMRRMMSSPGISGRLRSSGNTAQPRWPQASSHASPFSPQSPRHSARLLRSPPTRSHQRRRAKLFGSAAFHQAASRRSRAPAISSPGSRNG